MGYYILGIIIFLLLIVFISDLIRSSRNKDGENDDLYYDRYANRFYTRQYGEEFADENMEKEIAYENGKNSDIGVEPIYQNIEQMALQQRINEQDKVLEDVVPEDPDSDKQKR